ncbi:MAG: hypothetical protein Ct9H90mP22_4390 [Gammaproteobacteria bacterium]|nr:MAG: hypothetical protein Ct9H90mP22_4390 [Gammaproteobacteria bacterium]
MLSFKYSNIYSRAKCSHGIANKILSKISKINFLGMRIKNIKNSVHSGNPIRTEFFQSSDLDNEM